MTTYNTKINTPIPNRILRVILFSFILSSISAIVSAQGNLLITPKRVVFENGKRSQEMNLANIGKDTATYMISLIQLRMTEDGQFMAVATPDSGQLFADKNIRFFPRSVTLAPNEAQSIKVQVSKSSELKPGEYRSHFYFRAVPKEKPLGDSTPTAKDTTISVHITPVFGISMPVIIRIGECSSKINLSDVHFDMYKDTMPSLSLVFNRSGNMSSYGDLSIDHIMPDGKTTRVGIVRGLAVYAPNARRRFHLALDKNENYHVGKLRIVYADQSVNVLKLAEEVVVLK